MVILAAVDRSNRAEGVVSEAAVLADAFNDTIHVIHVLTRSQFVDLERTNVSKTGEAVGLDRIEEVAAEIAAEAAAMTDKRTETVGLIGNPADKVVNYASENDVRYIIVGPRKRSPTGKAVFGSIAQSILLKSDCPVITVVE